MPHIHSWRRCVLLPLSMLTVLQAVTWVVLLPSELPLLLLAGADADALGGTVEAPLFAASKDRVSLPERMLPMATMSPLPRKPWTLRVDAAVKLAPAKS